MPVPSRVVISAVHDVTVLLQAVQTGESGAANRLMDAVYGELRALAASRLAGERAEHTLQPTALVHEAWLRLGGDKQTPWQNRAHFFGAAAEAMRRILIDRARRRARLRHGGGQKRLNLDDVTEPGTEPADDQVIALCEALERFEQQDEPRAKLVRLRYFAGLTLEEAAEVLGISESTAKRWWVFAKAWLYQEITA
jgi:RNA polymerase sigma factor (TIGR02999 family)